MLFNSTHGGGSYSKLLGGIVCAGILSVSKAEEKQEYRWINAENVNLRNGSKSNDLVLAQLPRGTQVILDSQGPPDGNCVVKVEFLDQSERSFRRSGNVSCRYLINEAPYWSQIVLRVDASRLPVRMERRLGQVVMENSKPIDLEPRMDQMRSERVIAATNRPESCFGSIDVFLDWARAGVTSFSTSETWQIRSNNNGQRYTAISADGREYLENGGANESTKPLSSEIVGAHRLACVKDNVTLLTWTSMQNNLETYGSGDNALKKKKANDVHTAKNENRCGVKNWGYPTLRQAQTLMDYTTIKNRDGVPGRIFAMEANTLPVIMFEQVLRGPSANDWRIRLDKGVGYSAYSGEFKETIWQLSFDSGATFASNSHTNQISLLVAPIACQAFGRIFKR
jgi:hypothetical protein